MVYEGFFPDNTEVRKLFEQQREKPVFKKEPALYHVTTLFYPAENADHLYGTKVKLHVTSDQYERFLDRNFHLTGAEAIKIEKASQLAFRYIQLAGVPNDCVKRLTIQICA